MSFQQLPPELHAAVRGYLLYREPDDRRLSRFDNWGETLSAKWAAEESLQNVGEVWPALAESYAIQPDPHARALVLVDEENEETLTKAINDEAEDREGDITHVYCHLDQSEWDGKADFLAAGEFGVSGRCQDWFHAAGLRRALFSQAHCLKHFTFTRKYLDHEELYTGSYLDLSDFEHLEVLETFFDLVDARGDFSDILPRSLKRLAIQYDDTAADERNFATGGPPGWPTAPANAKEGRLSALENVEVLSDELLRHDDDPEIEWRRANAADVVGSCEEMFAEIGVKFEAVLDHQASV